MIKNKIGYYRQELIVQSQKNGRLHTRLLTVTIVYSTTTTA
nr:MAG TPA_asm: hypothetical protein [Caudoviricetes sp.]